MGRVSPLVPFGICTRRTGGAQYVPDFARSKERPKVSSRSFLVVRRRLAVDPHRAIPARPPISHSQPRQVKVLVQGGQSLPGICFANWAIRRCRVDTIPESEVSVMFPSTV